MSRPPPLKRSRKGSTSMRQQWEEAIGSMPSQLPWAQIVRDLECGLDEAIERLNTSGRPLRLGTPCAGFEAPLFAIRALGLKHVQHSFSIDLASHAEVFGRNLRKVLASQGVPSGNAWLGPENGDLLKLCADDLPAVDILVAGPPCPPWSSMGHREGGNDDRSRVFWHIIDIIGGLAARKERDALQCFILENVEGILRRDAHGHCGIDEVHKRLRKVVPDFFVTTMCVNSRNYSLPQNRPRVYVVGVRRKLMSEGRAISKPRPHMHKGRLSFARWLTASAPRSCHEVPARLSEKKRKWEAVLQKLDDERRPYGGWEVACAVLERDRDKTFANLRSDGLIGAVTTSPCLSFVWSRREFGEVPDSDKSSSLIPIAETRQRFIMPLEHLAFQGFPLQDPVLIAALAGLSDSDVLTGAGNAMSVPVVGAILGTIFARTAVGCSVPAPTLPCMAAATSQPTSVCSSPSEHNREDHDDCVLEDEIVVCLSVTKSVPKFATCGCWMHLRHHMSGDVRHICSDTLKLGRDPKEVPPCGLLVAPKQVGLVSRVHAQLSRSRRVDRCHLKDLGSMNGTLAKPTCNGGVWSKVTAEGCILENGALIAFGAITTPSPDFPMIFRVEFPLGVGCRGRALRGGA